LGTNDENVRCWVTELDRIEDFWRRDLRRSKRESKYRSMAAEHYWSMAPDTASEVKGLDAELLRHGATGRRADLASAAVIVERIGDPILLIMQQLTTQLDDRLADLTGAHGLLANLVCGPIIEPDFSAEHRFFSDGSGLVVVSGPLLVLMERLCTFVSRLANRASSPTFLAHMQAEGWPTPEKAIDLDDVHTLAGLLRYQLINMRFLDVSNVLGYQKTSDDGVAADVLLQHALKFVLAHEAAHHALGHSAGKTNSTTSDTPLTLDYSRQMEVEADALATEMVLVDDEGSSTRLPLLGAVTAMMSIDVAERGLLVRAGRTHPAAKHRLDHLYQRAQGRFRDLITFVALQIGSAIDLATDFNVPLPHPVWERTLTNTAVRTDLVGWAYVGSIADLDWLHTRDDRQLRQFVEESKGAWNIDLTDGIDLAITGRVDLALQSWGVKQVDIERIGDSLAFSTLHDILLRCATIRNVAAGHADSDIHTVRVMFAIIATTIIARQMRGSSV
jgi:hypothetical protein